MSGIEQHSPGAFSALPVDTVLDRYKIEDVIAAGGFGITYRCQHVALGKIYALKEHFPRQFAYRDGGTASVRPSDPDTFSWALERFVQEGRSLARCTHPNVVNVADVFEANGTAYMVLGYEAGRSLKRWLDELGRPPTQAEFDAILIPLLDALAYVHQQGLLHRDIAPDNIMIRSDGTPCLIDFGAARQAVAERSQMMSAIVKSGYSPPEQYTRSGRAQGPWSDIYALGATLYRALSGATPQESTERSIDDDLRPIGEAAEFRSQYRRSFLAAIDHALKLRYAERPQSVTAWAEALLSKDAATELASSVRSAHSSPQSTSVATPQLPPVEQPPAPRLIKIATETSASASVRPVTVEQEATNGPNSAASVREVTFSELASPAPAPARGRNGPIAIGTVLVLCAVFVGPLLLRSGSPVSNPTSTKPNVSLVAPVAQSAVTPSAPNVDPSAASIPEQLRWRMPSTFSKTDQARWSQIERLVGTVKQMSDNKVQLQPFAAGEITPAFQVLEAVQNNIVEAGFVYSGAFVNKEQALVMISGGMPLGLDASGFTRWATGNGATVRDKVFAKFGVKAVPCGFTAPRGFWSTKPLAGADAFKGLRLRTTIERSQIMSRVGAVPTIIPISEMYIALQTKVVDAGEIGTPSTDANLRIGEVGRNFYLPAFDSDFGYALDLIINKRIWDAAPAAARQILEKACRSSGGNQVDQPGLSELTKQKAKIEPLPTALRDQVRRESEAFIAERAKSDKLVAEIWDSLQKSR